MPYQYSRPKGNPGQYQSSPPSRVTPVPASSFSGKSAGGGLFPFIPSLTPTDSTTEDAMENAAEEAVRDSSYSHLAEHAENLREAAQNSERKKGNEQEREQVSAPNESLPGVNPYRIESVKDRISEQVNNRNTLNSLNRTKSILDRDQTGEGAGKAPDRIISGNGSDSILDKVISGNGSDLVMDRVVSGSGRDNIQPESIWRSFDEVELPDSYVSFGPSHDLEDAQVEQVQSTRPLTQTGTVSFENVQLPKKAYERKPVQSAQNPSIFQQYGNYVNRYMSDKMENPVRELAIQTGASVLAAPVLGAVLPASVTSAAVAPVASNITKLIPQATQTSAQVVSQNANNIVNFADYARKGTAIAAGVGGVAATLPAVAQNQTGWNAQTAKYTVQQTASNFGSGTTNVNALSTMKPSTLLSGTTQKTGSYRR